LPATVSPAAYDQFRERLIEARSSARLSQAELAKRLGKPQSYVSKFERGERRLDVIEFLEVAAALGVDACRILDGLVPSGGEVR
jgi:transcriptional regulator with XRE-family HTH domain